MTHRKTIRRKSRKTRKRTQTKSRIYGGKSDKEIRKAAKERIANRVAKINRNEANQQAARIAAQKAKNPDADAFSDYAGYHETGAPQATGAALRDVSIHPTNPVFSF